MSNSDGSALKRRTVKEIIEGDRLNIVGLIKTLIKSFTRTDSNYGVITDIKGDLEIFYTLLKDYIKNERLDIYALKFGDKILLSRTNFGFEEIYEVVKINSVLIAKRDMLELWDDKKNRILHLIIVPLRKHFPIEYSSPEERSKITETFYKGFE